MSASGAAALDDAQEQEIENIPRPDDDDGGGEEEGDMEPFTEEEAPAPTVKNVLSP